MVVLEGEKRERLQSVLGMYVRTGREVSKRSLGRCVEASSISLSVIRMCREDWRTSMRCYKWGFGE